ncbi:hypothetical protein KIW84_074430 [Lathyrus oleraceus]|uniref:DNA-directed RNA polymerase n=1 Tax=Pisum sativum TaxID=3888 RepID=A0A9D4ZWW0_PEA|nr:hypothetical protein KIW84_074430 [Pisum sativum]
MRHQASAGPGSLSARENVTTADEDHLNYERKISAALRQASVDAVGRVFRNIQSQYYIAHVVVESSFLTGLNPLECFVHSVMNRDSYLNDDADLPGTLTHKLMFSMHDMYDGYDGSARNLYRN